ncbi:hypothetical protein CYLTODRAFT_89322 [Cylindrobasidium torrendii FP15055 ss-10]|uniref:Uncharacterized protein n=1 Tax=Cylindrobasidium torrendii FP15055 ss-10 TaxID=1314674 RepID=A0A0D7B361_9AGAR|nr:hypothetical protein CYLTODRAFT_89322 [Cylindrobasidium torrendii FP15055 ss-10]
MTRPRSYLFYCPFSESGWSTYLALVPHKIRYHRQRAIFAKLSHSSAPSFAVHSTNCLRRQCAPYTSGFQNALVFRRKPTKPPLGCFNVGDLCWA